MTRPRPRLRSRVDAGLDALTPFTATVACIIATALLAWWAW